MGSHQLGVNVWLCLGWPVGDNAQGYFKTWAGGRGGERGSAYRDSLQHRGIHGVYVGLFTFLLLSCMPSGVPKQMNQDK